MNRSLLKAEDFAAMAAAVMALNGKSALRQSLQRSLSRYYQRLATSTERLV